MSTPRVASFDELRVGQWVALTRLTQGWVGRVEVVPDSKFGTEVVAKDSAGSTFHFSHVSCDAGEVIILREVPEPPVKVRREDYDWLMNSALSLARVSPASRVAKWDDLRNAAHALIDNAEVDQ